MGINLDLSKTFHPRVLDLLWAFMPGFFFEICLLFVQPQLVAGLLQPPLGRAEFIVIAVILSFIIGNAFLLWVRLLQTVLSWFFRQWSRIVPKLWSNFLQYLLKTRGTPPQQSWLARRRFVQNAYRNSFDHDEKFQAFYVCQIITRTLKEYGIDPPDRTRPIESWIPWASIVGGLEGEDVRGYMLVVATHACGWAGLVARQFAPSLHAKYFLWFCLFSIGSGLLHDIDVAYRLGDVESSWILGARRTFEELKRSLKKDNAPEEADDDAKV